MRGKFKQEFKLKKEKLFHTDVAVVGDVVEFEVTGSATGVIEKIDKRKNYLSRKAPKQKGASYRGERLEQIVASNIDNFFIITSAQSPPFNNKTLDRFLVAGESSYLQPIIILNKIDLVDEEMVDYWRKMYEQAGYNFFPTSVLENSGIYNLKHFLQGKINLFWGQSGVGKSSLLNKIYPQLKLEVGEISKSWDRGKHTTVTVSMERISENTFIIDTPGIREIDPFGIKKEDLYLYFKEFIPFGSECRYPRCTHEHEPECGIATAVEKKFISAARYDSYLRLLNTIEEDIVF